MAKLTRVTAKVFGETADATLADPQIGQFGSAKAGTYNGTNDVATIQALPAWSNGWIDAVTPTQQFPALPERTGVDKVLSYQSAYLLQQGIAEWDNGTTYYINSFCSKNGKIYISETNENIGNDPENSNANWKEFTSGGSGFNLFDTKVSDHILEGEEAIGWALQGTYVYKGAIVGGRFGYPDFYAECIAQQTAGTATQVTLGASTVTMSVNANGHIFYNIADKATVDTYYAETGIADFYGIDTENERVFLPRNKYFHQLTDDPSKVNDYVEAGLPDHRHSYTFKNQWGGDNSGGDSNSINNATFQTGLASESNPIYGKSDTVQPPSSLKLLYYCVGNTVSDTSWVNVVEQVEEGVLDLENATNEGLSALSNASNALRQTQITNCLLEVPQNINLELTDGILTLKAGSEVIVPNGFEEDGTTPKFDYLTVESDLTVSDTWGTAEKVAIFVSQDATRLRMAGLGRLSSGTTAPTATNEQRWYDTSTNLVKSYSGGSYTGTNLSFPIAICTKTSASSDTILASVNQVFNGMGYIGSTVWVDKGVKALIPDDRNADGTLKNFEYITTKVLTRTDSSGTAQYCYGINPFDGNLGALRIQDYIIGGEKPQLTSGWWFDTVNNIFYNVSNGEFIKAYRAPVIIATKTNGVISNFQPKQPFSVMDYSSTPHITETYVNGTSWYRVYSDGWCEQGGQAPSGTTSVTLLKKYSDTNYNVQTTSTYNGDTYSTNVTLRTTTSFNFIYNGSAVQIWFACGYIS